jgi:oligopeptide transport system ATP-binding protein
VAGRVVFRGTDLMGLGERDLEDIRGRDLAMVFQDPLSSLDPVMSVGEQVAEVFRRHLGQSKIGSLQAAAEVMDRVKIPHADKRLRDYPHQFSGGMRQRVMLAIALALRPRLLIADEPTTALDVTVQAQIIDLLARLRDDAGSALILISHDLGLAAALSNKIAVMYAGRFVEIGAVRDLYTRPAHPYTKGLLASVPRSSGAPLLQPIAGSPPSLIRIPPGCPFHPRCHYAAERCSTEAPILRRPIAERLVACHFSERILEGRKPDA